MLPPDSRATAFELFRPPSGHRLDFAVLTTYTLDLEALLVLPLSVLAHPDGGLEELLADPLRLHQAIRDAGDRVHAFVDEKGIAIPRGARSLYSLLESSVHPVRAPNGGAFHPKAWVARFTAKDEAAEDLLRVAILSRNLNFDRSWDVALASEALFQSRRYVAASRPLRDFLVELPRLATAGNRVPHDTAERVEGLADQVWRTAFPAPEGFDSPIEFHAIGVEASLRPLKPFQRRTVEHAFHRLFKAEDSTGRFLVADEVGLGKTLVARGIIARAIDHLWNDVERIDIVYICSNGSIICSNGSIARANLPKLQVGGAEERSFALATRLTMLATELARRDGEQGLADSKLNFVSFTPGTSFNLGHSAGQGREREVLFQLLDSLVGPRIALMNLLQGWITKRDRWRRRLVNHPRPIDDTIRQSFEAAFRQRPDLEAKLRGLLDTTFRCYHSWPAEARYQRDQIISELRRLLAGACLEALQPDLVILDEFQRFRNLLGAQGAKRDAAADLAQELFQAEVHGKRVPTLLLSATPYKLYTADAEIEHEEHYEDFLATTRFLLGDDTVRVEELKQQLSLFGAALRGAAAGEPDQVERVERAKREVEDSLRGVMARTERVAASEDRDAMVTENRCPTPVTSSDVRQYLAADALFRAVDGQDPMPFWKSAPYLAHFMQGYRFHDLLVEALGTPGPPDRIVDALQRHDSAFLKAATLRSWGSIDPAHAKLRELVSELIGEGLWRLLWIPPTLPYWPLRDHSRTRSTQRNGCCSRPGTSCRTSSARSSATKRNGG